MLSRRVLMILVVATLVMSLQACTGQPQPDNAAPEQDQAAAHGLKPPRHGGVYVVAHRGAHNGIPENTLAAYRKAIELGADFVEVDIRQTKDGRFVSVHNKDVDAYVSGVTGLVKDFTLDELRALDIGSRVGPDWTDERIPTFEEILDLCKGKIGIYLDLKDAPVDALIEMIRARGMERDVLWYADLNQLKRVKELCPDCVPMPDPLAMELLPTVIEQMNPKVVAASWSFFSEDFVRQCHDAGAITIVDEDGPECWEDALKWGADGIQTDDPEKLIAFLDSRSNTNRR